MPRSSYLLCGSPWRSRTAAFWVAARHTTIIRKGLELLCRSPCFLSRALIGLGIGGVMKKLITLFLFVGLTGCYNLDSTIKDLEETNSKLQDVVLEKMCEDGYVTALFNLIKRHKETGAVFTETGLRLVMQEVNSIIQRLYCIGFVRKLNEDKTK